MLKLRHSSREAGEDIGPATGSDMDLKTTLDEFLKHQHAKGNSPRTVEYYQQTLGDFVRWMDRRTAITPAVVDDFLSELREGWQPPMRHPRFCKPRSPHTLAKYQRAVRAFVYFAVERGYMPPIKVKVKRPPRPRPRVLTEQDVRTLFQACKRPRDKLIVRLLIDTGARASEALKMTWEDVDPESCKVRIQEGKGGKDRTVVMSEPTVDLLRQLPNGGGRILRTIKGTPFTYQGLRKMLDRLEAKTGIECNPHTLRRTFATLSVKNGMPAFQLQRLLGHSQIETTLYYVGLVEDDLVTAHKEYGPLSQITA